jgi:hypothetical protein
VNDAASERTAALRANDPNLNAEEEERRWGSQQGREIKRQRREKRSRDAATRTRVEPLPPKQDPAPAAPR